MEKDLSSREINILVIQFHHQHLTRLSTQLNQIGLSRGQPPVLSYLKDHQGCTQVDIATSMYMAPATVTKILQRMERDGWVTRQLDPEDQRILRVYLTEAGEKIQDAMWQIEGQVGDEFLEGFSAEEKRQLSDYLVRMRKNLIRLNCKDTCQESSSKTPEN